MTARLWAAAVALPPMLLVLLVHRHAVDVPFWDQWEFVGTLAHSLEHGPRWSELWAQHNEHRLVVPKLLMIALAAITGWDVRFEMTASLLVAAGVFVLLGGTVRAAAREAGGGATLVGAATLLVSLLVFSPAQWENWLWGWQLQIFVNVLAVAGAIRLLTLARPGPAALAGAIGCALVAAYSFANGIAVWIVGALILALRGPWSPRVMPRVPTGRLLVWAVAGIASSAAYMIGYEAVPWHPSPGDGLRDPGTFVLHVLHYLGGPIGGLHAGASAVAGLLGSALLFAGAWRLIARDTLPRHVVLALAAPGVYAGGCATITAIGRAGLGPEQALASKYVTLAMLLWVSVVGLAAAILAARVRDVRLDAVPDDDAARSADPGVALAAAALALVVVGATASGAAGVRAAAARGRLLAPYPELLLRHASLPPAQRRVLASIHPSPQLLDEDLATLERRRLSVFRHRAGSSGSAP